LSARDRARINELIALNELYFAYKENGQTIPAWLNYGIANKEKMDNSYALAEEVLDQIPELLQYCTPGGQDQKTLERAQATTERFIAGVNAMRELPKQAPKHREALLALWQGAQEQFIEVAKCVEVWGVTPEQKAQEQNY
jgi:hypothetical protein